MTPERFLRVVKYAGSLSEAFEMGYSPQDVEYGDFRDLLEWAYAEHN